MSTLNLIRTALQGVSENGLRAALTTLGIVIGVASVVAMLALGNGARAAVEANFRFLGSDNIQVAVEQKITNGKPTPVGKILSYEDGLHMPGTVELVNSVDMSVQGTGKVRHDRVALDTSVTGTTANALDTMAAKNEVQPARWPGNKPLNAAAYLESGRFFDESEVLSGASVCILGYQTALDLFQGDDPLDQTVWINRQRCLVVGVMAELETVDPGQRQRMRPNEAFYLPISTAIRVLYKDEPSVAITAHVGDQNRMDEAKAQIAAYLRQRHGIEKDSDGSYKDDFNMTTRRDILGAQQESARTFSLLLAAMAVVSLTVGGIGIMNVMLVSVTERTREIGVRLAVGARQRDVVLQFLLEAALLSAGGGVLGVASGVLAIPLAAALNKGAALLAPESVPLALGMAVLSGILFGLYPALRASRLDPIEALRYE